MDRNGSEPVNMHDHCMWWLKIMGESSTWCADQLSTVILAQQLCCQSAQEPGKLLFLFGRPAIEQFSEAIVIGGTQFVERLLPGSSELEFTGCLPIALRCSRDQPILRQAFY